MRAWQAGKQDSRKARSYRFQLRGVCDLRVACNHLWRSLSLDVGAQSLVSCGPSWRYRDGLIRCAHPSRGCPPGTLSPLIPPGFDRVFQSLDISTFSFRFMVWFTSAIPVSQGLGWRQGVCFRREVSETAIGSDQVKSFLGLKKRREKKPWTEKREPIPAWLSARPGARIRKAPRP